MNNIFPISKDQAIELNECPLIARKQINDLEKLMLAAPESEKVAMPPRHYFAKGIYAREITIPAGTILTGKIHKTEHLCIISKGKIIVATEFGTEIIEAPATLVSKPGTKRAGHVLEECVWTAIHATNETDLEKLEKELIAENHEEIEGQVIEAQALHGGNECHG